MKTDVKLYLKLKVTKAKEWLEVNRRSIASLVVGFILGAIIY